MRILCTYAGGSGHADPLVPVADAVRAAGHDVAFFGRRSAPAALDANGFTLFPDTDDRALAAGDDAPITPLLELDMEREYRDLRGFADRIARARMAGTLELADHWRPDLLVCDEADYGSMLGAERLRLPHATVLTNASGSFLRAVDIAEPLDAIRVELGLPPDPRLTMPARDLVIAPFPPSFRDPAFPLPGNAISIRPDPGRSLPGSAPDWLSHLPDAPTVYFTLGTIFNQESGDLFDRVHCRTPRPSGHRHRHRRTEHRSAIGSARSPTTCTSSATSRRPCCCPTAILSSTTAGPAALSARSRTVFRWSCSRWAPTSSRTLSGVCNSAWASRWTPFASRRDRSETRRPPSCATRMHVKRQNASAMRSHRSPDPKQRCRCSNDSPNATARPLPRSRNRPRSARRTAPRDDR